MNKILFYIFFGLSLPALAQSLPGRREMKANGQSGVLEYPKVSGKTSGSTPRYGFSTPNLDRRIVRDSAQGAVSYLSDLRFSKNTKNQKRNLVNMSFDFLNEQKQDLRILKAEDEFVITKSITEASGIKRVSMQQMHKNIPIYGAELGLHSNDQGVIEFMMGKVFPTPKIDVKPKFSEQKALEFTYADLKTRAIVQKEGLVSKLLEMDPDKGKLTIFSENGKERLVYEMTIRPNVLERWVYFVDAHSGEIIDKYNHTCTLDGVISASSKDLNNINRTFNAYQIGGNYVMIDTKKKMFNQVQSKLPDSPVGAILTIDARNARVDNEDMDLYHVVSNNPNQWNATAVSAHNNASLSYDYYEKTFQRNSLNGSGGNIISVINIADEDGKGFDNAFWNGIFMGYGNGGGNFHPLAKSLDVAGHEMTHGVIENTARLEYRNQSGALNESFADIFGVMIDRDNWTLGEDVVKSSAFPSGALRSLSNPNQNGRNVPGYQPMHMNQYQVLKDTPEQDNGGVHINSGIPNHAYYLFATASGMTKEKAEKVYYHALTTYLGRTSKFLDLRLAVIQSCKDIYKNDPNVEAAAKAAFDKVGIVDQNGNPTNPSKENEVKPNPGQGQMLAYGLNASDERLYIANFNFNSTMNFTPLTNKVGVLSKPSVTDDGKFVAYVANDQEIYVLNMETRQSQRVGFDKKVKWFNAAISKDGKRLAAILDETENNNYIYVFDLVTGKGQMFELYNPTYSGVNSGKVLFAEAIEWDLSGEYLVYDAQNQVGGWFSSKRTFYDVGILRAWDPRKNTFGDGAIDKIFSDVPVGTSIGNPTFAKTNSGILAFDFIDHDNDKYYILTADLNKHSGGIQEFETNTIGFPDFSKTDEHLTFNYISNNKYNIVGVALAADKITPKLDNVRLLASDKIYGVSFANGNRELPKVLEQEISIASIGDLKPGQSFDISASVSSNLPLIYSLVSGDAAINGKRVTLGNTPGKVKIRVSQIGNSQYAATYKETEFCSIPNTPTLVDQGNYVSASGGNLYQFFVNGWSIGGYTTNVNLNKSFEGVYTVRAVTQDGCVSSSSNAISNTIVLGNEEKELQIKILPNPVIEEFEVKISSNEKIESLEIISLDGKTVWKSNQKQNNIKNLASGMYLIKVKTDENEYSTRIFKQ